MGKGMPRFPSSCHVTSLFVNVPLLLENLAIWLSLRYSWSR